MDSFDYRIDFPEIYRDWPCCKLFLQPFVENSIKHGFAEKDSRCLIDVCGCSEGNRLVLTIEDNGCGMTLEQNAKVRELISEKAAINLKGTGIGLENVTARMRLYYGSGFEIDFRTQTDSGTIFILKLPIPEILKGENEKDENSDS
jgi:two-component system sensor histidine kinase YesM